jgi:hypothetical protein
MRTAIAGHIGQSASRPWAARIGRRKALPIAKSGDDLQVPHFTFKWS